MEDPDGLIDGGDITNLLLEPAEAEPTSGNLPHNSMKGSIQHSVGSVIEAPLNSVLNGEPSTKKTGATMNLNVAMLTIFSAIGGFLFGFDTGVIGGALLFMGDDFALNSLTQSIIVSAAVLGAVLGSVFGGPLADSVGRKPTIQLACVVFTLGGTLMAFATSIEMLTAGRVVVGLGIGVASVVVPVYIAESSPAEFRGALVSTNVLFITTGQFISYGVCLAFSRTQYNWRFMLGISVVPAIFCFIGLLFLTESPRWLVAKDKLFRARASLERVYGGDLARSKRELRDICIAAKNEPRGTVQDLCCERVNRRALFIGVGLMIFQQFCAINTVMYFTPQILKNAMGDLSDVGILKWSLLPAGTNAVMTVVGILLIDRIGRRLLLLSSVTGSCISLVLMALASQFQPHLVIWCVVLFLFFFAPGLGPVPWAINAEIYALKVRALGNSVAATANWISNFLISLTFLLIGDSINYYGAFYLYAGISVLAFIWIFMVVPETKGKTLEDIQAMLKQKKKLCGGQGRPKSFRVDVN